MFEFLSGMLPMQKNSERSSFYKDLQNLWNLGLLQELFCEKLVGLVFFSKVQGPNFSQEMHTV